MANVPSQGWYAEVTANGYTHVASVIEGQNLAPQQNPKANQRPGIRLPVTKADKWQEILGDGSTDIDLAVWHDGVRQPIDTLVDVEQTDRATVLVGEGGRELKTRVEASFDQKAVHTAAQDLVDNNTSYVSNVDTPPTTTETNTTLVTWTTTSDWLTHSSAALDTFPVGVSGGSILLRQTCFTTEAEAHDRNNGTATFDDDKYSGNSPTAGQGFAVQLADNGDWVEYDFTLNHDIPAEDFELPIRLDTNTTGTDTGPELTVTINDHTWTPVSGSTSFGSLDWRDFTDSTVGGIQEGYDGGDLLAGSHTLRIEATTNGTVAHHLDVVAPRDGGGDRFSPNYTDDNTLTDGDDGGTYLSGPELFPAAFQVAFDLVPAPQAVTGIRAEATLDEGASDYTHFVSNDQGANFTTGTGSNFETDSLGASFGPGITYKAGLSRTGTRTNGTPTSGFNGTDLQDLTLKADLEDMPLVVNRTFDGHLDSILAELAQIGDQLWSYERDGATESVEWATPGQRTATEEPNINDYRATKTVGEVYQKAIVYGQSDVEIVGERFESNHGVAVSLANDRLQQGSERVTDPDTGQRFRRGADYTMDYQAGSITVLAGGDMADATTFEIDYRYQAYGEFDDGTASPNVTPRIDLPGLWSDFLCQQAARLIIDEVSTPIHTAEVTIPNDETGWSVVESLDPAIVPTGGNALHIREPVNTPESTVLTLGSRRTLDDVVGDIRAQVGAVSRKA